MANAHMDVSLVELSQAIMVHSVILHVWEKIDVLSVIKILDIVSPVSQVSVEYHTVIRHVPNIVMKPSVNK